MKPKFRTCGALLGSAVLFFSVSQTRAADGTWSVDDNGAWSEDVKWASSVIADGAGFTANFTNDQTADATITLDTPRSIGHLVFGDADTGTACSWLLTGSVLTLDATTPSITVDNLASGSSATISTVLAGTAGLTKLGSGSLVLSGLNTYTGLTTATAGTLTISGNAIKTGILVNGGTMNVQAGNTMSGGITVDSGELTLSGANTFSAGTTINGGTVNAALAGAFGSGNLVNNGNLNLTAPTAGDITYTGMNTVTGSGTINVSLLSAGTANTNFTSTRLLNGNYSGFTGTINIGPSTGVSGGKIQFNGLDSSAVTLNVKPNASVYLSSNVVKNSKIVLEGGDLGETLGQLRLDTGNWAGEVVLAGVATGVNDGLVGSNAGGTISGLISETGGSREFTKAGAGTINLAGVANTFTGDVRVLGGTLGVTLMGTTGSPSSLGQGTTVHIGNGTGSTSFNYLGAGESSNRVINLAGTIGGGVVNHNGTGALTLTASPTATGVGGKTLTLSGNAVSPAEYSAVIGNIFTNGSNHATTASAAFTTAVNTITVASVTDVAIGSTIAGTGIVGGTRVTAISGTGPYTITLSANTNAAGASGQAISFTQVNALSKTGSGLWKLSANNTYTGITSLTGGVLEISHANALGSATSGTVQSGGAELRLTGNITTAAETLSINGGGIGNAGALRNFSGDNTYTGPITMAAQSRINSDSGTLTLNAATAISGAFNLVVGGAGNTTISGGMAQGVGGVSKDGSGTLILSGLNTFTGGSSVNGGTLKLDYGVNNTSKLSDTGVLTLGGGTVELSGGTHSEVVLSTSLTAGSKSNVARSNGATGVLHLNTITPGSGAVVNFTDNNIATTDNLNDASGILGGWATVTVGGVTEWATNSTNAADGLITAFSAYNDITRLLTTPVPDSLTANVLIINGGTSGDLTLTTAPLNQISSLKMVASDGASTISYTADTDTLMIGNETGGGIHQTSTAGSLIIGVAANNGILTTGLTVNATAATLNFINESANDIIANAKITNNGTDIVSVAKLGSGRLVLNGANTFTGTLALNEGSVQLGSALALVSNGPLTMGASTLLDLNGNNATISSITTQATSSITDANAGTGLSTLSMTNAGGGVAASITDGATRDIALRVTNANGGFFLSNPANTFSGGIVLANSGGGTRMAPGTVAAGAYGAGSITVGEAATDKAAIFFATANQTFSNPIIANTGLGTDRVGTIRVATTGIVLTGTLTANLADFTFSTNETGSITATGKITGTNGVKLLSHTLGGTALTVTLSNAAQDNDYAGNTTINENPQVGRPYALNLGAAEQIPHGAGKGNVTVNTNGTGIGTLNLVGFSETINGLNGTGTITSSAGTPVLTIGENNAVSSHTGIITGSLSLVKNGTGSLTLGGSAASTYTGTTILNGGTVTAGKGSAFGAAGATSGTTINAGVSLNTNSQNFGAERFTLAGGTVKNEGASDQINTTQRLDVIADSLIGGLKRLDVRGGAIGGLTIGTGAKLTKVDANLVAVVDNPIVNNGTIQVDSGVFGLHFRVPMTGSGNINIKPGAEFQVGSYGAVCTVSNPIFVEGGTIAGIEGNTLPSSYESPITTAGNVTLRADANFIINGAISGTGSLNKTGGATLTVNGATSHTGNTTVTAGTLTLTQASTLDDASSVSISATGTLNLVASGDDEVASLTIAGTQVYGIWGAVGSGAPNESARITGAGRLVVDADPFTLWAQAKGLDGTAGKEAGKTDDPDGDGSNNLAEFAFGGNPLSGADNAKSFVFAADSSDAGTDKDLILTIAVRTGTPAFTGSPSPTATHDGIIYNIEGSLDLAGFASAVSSVDSVITGLPALAGGYEYRSFSLDVSNGLTGKGFLRAKVTAP
jgi:autotransporter-associated beta strand protein